MTSSGPRLSERTAVVANNAKSRSMVTVGNIRYSLGTCPRKKNGERQMAAQIAIDVESGPCAEKGPKIPSPQRRYFRLMEKPDSMYLCSKSKSPNQKCHRAWRAAGIMMMSANLKNFCTSTTPGRASGRTKISP